MEKTITFTMTESQAKEFENLLDEFNNTIIQPKKLEESKDVVNISDTIVLLNRAKEELKKIKLLNKNRGSRIWEQ